MPALKKTYIDTGNVLYIYRDFPDSDLGIQTHMISHCIGSGDRSRFLEALYGRKLGGATGQIHFTAAEQLGFSREKIDSCLADPKLRSDVVSLMDGMKRLNLYAFPTFFINSEMTVGQAPLEFFEAKFNVILALASDEIAQSNCVSNARFGKCNAAACPLPCRITQPSAAPAPRRTPRSWNRRSGRRRRPRG